MRKFFAVSAAAVAVAAPVLAVAPSAAAHDRGRVFTAELNPVPTNNVTGSGTATVELEGLEATVTVRVSGLLAGVPHAMHIHVDGQGRCPKASESSILNGHRAMSTADGMKAYGMIGTSLTTSGDTSPASALAVTRFPTGDMFTYQRSIKVTSDVAEAIRRRDAVIVVHGIDYDGSGKFTNVLGASELDPALPEVATAPALCGALTPQGREVEAGAGGTQGLQQTGLYTAGGALLAAAGGAATLARRRRKAAAQD